MLFQTASIGFIIEINSNEINKENESFAMFLFSMQFRSTGLN